MLQLKNFTCRRTDTLLRLFKVLDNRPIQVEKIISVHRASAIFLHLAVQELSKNTEIIIKPTGRAEDIVIKSMSDYKKEAYRQLNIFIEN